MNSNQIPFWSFPECGGNIGNTGLNNINSFFKDNTILSLSREICQNSIDAKQKNCSEPVRLDFHLFYLTKETFPGFDYFSKVIDLEIKYAKEHFKNNKSTIKFYNSAKELLNQERIPCLRISDYNTTGLVKENFDNLVKNVGISDKDENSGGSFGLGKFATYACSKLNTIFYSSYDIDNQKASQGVSRLSTFENENGKKTYGLGFYGSINETRLNDLLNLDEDCHRTTPGTDIFILGFNASPNWKNEIISAIIRDFMVSIFENKLNVRVEDIVLTKDTIIDVFNVLKAENTNLFNVLTPFYFSLLTENEYPVSIYYYSMFDENDIQLKLSINNAPKNRVAIIKSTGMKIFERDRLPTIPSYSGILLLKGARVNDYFQKLENPAHNFWSTDRIEDEAEKSDAHSRMNELFKFIREKITDISEKFIPPSIDAEGVGEFLPDEEFDGNNNNITEDLSDNISTELDVKETNTKRFSKENDFNPSNDNSNLQIPGNLDANGEYDDIEFTDHNENSHIKSNTHHATPDDDGNVLINTNNFVAISPQKIRCFNKNNEYIFIFSVSENYQKISISIKISGEQSNEKAKIISAFDNNNLSLSFQDDTIYVENINSSTQYKIRFSLESINNYSLEVKINGYK